MKFFPLRSTKAYFRYGCDKVGKYIKLIPNYVTYALISVQLI